MHRVEFQKNSATQILREINFGHSKKLQMVIFLSYIKLSDWDSKSTEINFAKNWRGRIFFKFSYCDIDHFDVSIMILDS